MKTMIAMGAMMANWISVKERLPETGERVLIRSHLAFNISNIWGYTAISFRRSEEEIEYLSQFNDDSFTCDCWDGQESNGYTVTHWMPLPEPPEEE